MSTGDLLNEISDFCRKAGLAESTFGRAAINDGKLVRRLRNGGRITTETLDRIRAFMANYQGNGKIRPGLEAMPPRDRPEPRTGEPSSLPPRAGDGFVNTGASNVSIQSATQKAPDDASGGEQNFRFYDNRQKYLMFVNTCSEKWEVANRVTQELSNLHPRPPAVRVFDAGVGDGTILSRVMRSMHARFPTMPFYVAGKEISLEDVRLTLQKMPDRFFEHPATVLVLTNLQYANAPWLTVRDLKAASSLVWEEVRLTGNTSSTFEEQITALEPFLAKNWNAHTGKTGNSVYDRPAVLVIYRDDHRFLLDPIIPRQGLTPADYDLVIASQPYRAKASVDFKAKRVIAPLVRALGPGGRLIGIHSYGNDPGMEIIRKIWPDDDPFVTNNRHDLLKAVKSELGAAARNYNFNANSDAKSLFRYEMHTLPTEVAGAIGTSTLFAAWNDAIYVAQVEDARLGPVVSDTRYMEATQEILHKHGGLWFWDESFVISRRRE
ncbi:MAG: hypothetical protein AB7F96_10780 [Beijerinckiaceae bacterium]